VKSNLKVLLLIPIPIACTVWLASGTSAQAATEYSDSKHPVIVELFTSEGCSSCPPADSVLAALPEVQTNASEIITISEHVDYWNYLGWADPFSSGLYTERQRQYARALNQAGMYTPEMIVNGKQGLVGSDSRAALAAINTLSTEPKKLLHLKASIDTDHQKVAIRLNSTGIDLEHNEQLIFFVTEDELSVHVRSGENGGRTLKHTNVARAVKVLDTLPQATLSLTVSLSKPGALKVVAIIQNKQTMAITAAGQTRVELK
jgi:hypothetical protein